MVNLINQNKQFKAFAIIVDINQYTQLVSNAESSNMLLAQFIRDLLSGSIQAVEKNNGLVVGLMGDAFLAFIESSEDVFGACVAIANDVDKVNEYLCVTKFLPPSIQGIKIKIGVEFGYIDVADISCQFLGKQKLFASTAINFASRISDGGNRKLNRCLIGPIAASNGLDRYVLDGPFQLKGKSGEQPYKYYNLDLDDIWRNHPKENSWR
jgi:class 3 adenylate cyclase